MTASCTWSAASMRNVAAEYDGLIDSVVFPLPSAISNGEIEGSREKLWLLV